MKYPCIKCGKKFERYTGSRAKLCLDCWVIKNKLTAERRKINKKK